MRSGHIAADIDAYIAAAPATVRARLEQMRATIAKAAPDASEAIAYGLPTFRLHGNLVHFAAFAKHIGFYPGPEAINAHAAELTAYVTSKGTIQFPLDAPLPLKLVAKITTFRVQQSIAMSAAKAKRAALMKSAAKQGAATKGAAKNGTATKGAAKNDTATKAAARKAAAPKSIAPTRRAR